MLLLLIYNIFLCLFSPFLFVFYIHRVFAGKDTILSFFHKFGVCAFLQKFEKYDIWFHASSVGEVKSLEFVIEKYADKKILITTATLKSAEIVKNYRKSNIFHKFLPIDVPPFLLIFFIKNNCKTVIISESELWPNFFLFLRLFRKNVTLYNARISKSSQKKWLKIPSLLKFILSTCNKGVIAQSNGTKEFLGKFCNVKYFGNLKMLNLKNNFTIDEVVESFCKNNKPILCIASTHSGEDESIIKQIAKFQEKYNIIYVPRHPHRCSEISKIMLHHNLSYTLYSNFVPSNCLLADKIGILFYILSRSSIVIFGGSFLPHLKGHNILEAATFGCNIITGKFVETFEEIIAEMSQQNAIIQCNIEDISQEIANIEKLSIENSVGQNAKKFVENNMPNQQIITDFLTCP